MLYDIVERLCTGIHLSVQDQIGIFRNQIDFHQRPVQTLHDLLLRIRAAASEPSQQFCSSGRCDKYQYCLREFFPDLHSSLHFDLQQDIPAGVHILLHKSAGGPVIVVDKSRMFQKTVVFHKFFECLVCHKVIIDTVYLIWSGLTRGHRYRETVSVMLSHQAVDHCSLSGTAEAGNYCQFSFHSHSPRCTVTDFTLSDMPLARAAS